MLLPKRLIRFICMNIQKLITPLLVIIAIAAILKFFILPNSNQKPKLSEIKDQVYELMSEIYCDDNQVEIDLKKAEIDEYVKGESEMPINGWPVRISADINCKQGDKKYTQKLTLDEVAFFVRSKTLGGYDVFLPKEFLEMKKQIEEQMKNAFQ